MWYHPERTLEQAKQDMERCYYEAYLIEQGVASPRGPEGDATDPLMYVEMSARQCMKHSGYEVKYTSHQKIDTNTRCFK